MNVDPFKEYLRESKQDKADKGYVWSTAIGLAAVLCIHVPCGILYIRHAALQGLLTSRTWLYALIYLVLMIVFTILFGQKLLSKRDSHYLFDENEIEAGERFVRKMGISR